MEIEIPIEAGDDPWDSREDRATYLNIKRYVQERYGVNVHTGDIAEVKRACGMGMRLNYNISKKENPVTWHCTEQRAEYIREALAHYGVI